MGNRQKRPVVVLSLFDTGLGAVRSLGRAGVPVVGIDSDARMPGYASRYCRALTAPDPSSDPEGLLTFMLELAGSFDDQPIAIPASDAYVLFLSRYRESLAKHYRFLLPPADIAEAMIDKRLMHDLAVRTGTPIPWTCFPETMDEVRTLASELDYPVLIKPYVGHVWRATYGAASKGFKVATPEQLIERFQEVMAAGLDAMVQTIVLGPTQNLYEFNVYIDREGIPLARFTQRKIHQHPPEFGVGTCTESIDSDELAHLGMRFVQGIGYRGMASVEFKRDDRDGQFKLIELNPRLWLQHSLAIDCGVDFPMIVYRDLSFECPEVTDAYQIGRRWLDPALDLVAYTEYRAEGLTTLGEWVRAWQGVASFPAAAGDDPMPSVVKWLAGLAKVPKYLQRGRTN